MSPIKIFIVDDELPARERIKTLLTDIQAECPVQITGEAAEPQTALNAILEAQPDIVLLDVQMPGMTGIEFAQILSSSSSADLPAIIFVTAYDEYALKAFDVHAIDYLLKPVRASRLQEAILRASKIRLRDQESAISDAAKESDAKRQHFTILERNRVLLVPVSEVLFLKAEQKYVTLFTAQRSYLLEESLTSIEQDLSDILVRVHRNALVARNAIKGVERATHIVDADNEGEKVSESWQVLLKGTDEKLPISRRQWPVIKALVR